ncbi:MAG: hypothetical protein JST90_15980 [Bacteroidetes bacterium]|nr:hypothetical protein [Bacteroidota bacterium]
MPPLKTNIEKTIPEELKNLIKDRAGDKFSVYEDLKDDINKFVREYNLQYPASVTTKRLPKLHVDTIKSAIWGKPQLGFSETTANVLCLYATLGLSDWEAFLGNDKYSHLITDYTFPRKILNSKGKEEQPIIQEPSSGNSADLGTDPILSQYLQRYTTKFRTVSLPIARELTRIDISEIVPPLLKTKETSPEMANISRRERLENRSDIKIEEEISSEDKILIVGDGGCGKSTLLQWLFYQYADEWINNNSVFFPIFVDLGKSTSIKSYIENDFSCLFYQLQPLFTQYIPLFIFDGLDENESQGLFIDLQHFTENLNDFRIVISSRVRESLDRLLANGYTQYEIIANTSNLPELILKDSKEVDKFNKYASLLNIPKEIRTNFMLYTCLLVHFIKSGGINLVMAKAQILRMIIETDFVKYWELANRIDRHKLPSEFAMFNCLSSIALLLSYSKYFKLHSDYHALAKLGEKGFPENAMSRIAEASMSESGYDMKLLFEFYLDSGILIKTHEDLYLFSNKVLQDYFVARGLNEILCKKSSVGLLISTKDLRIDFYRIMKQSDLTFELFLGLIESPDNYIKELYQPLSYYQMYADRRYLIILRLICKIIGTRNEVIDAKTKTLIIEQVKKFMLYPDNIQSRLTCFILSLFYTPLISPNFKKMLRDTYDESVFDQVFENILLYYDNKYLSDDDWIFLDKFPQKVESVFKDTLDNASSNNHRNFGKNFFKHMHENHPIWMISFYLKALNPLNAANSVLQDKYTCVHCAKSFTNLWDAIKVKILKSEHKASLLEFIKISVRNIISPEWTRSTQRLCEELFWSCKDEEFITIFLDQLQEVLLELLNQGEIEQATQLSYVFRPTRNFSPGHKDKVTEIFSILINGPAQVETEAYFTVILNSQLKIWLSPIMADKLRKLLKGDTDLILHGLTYLTGFTSEITKEDKDMIIEFINSPKLCYSALILLSKLKLEYNHLMAVYNYTFSGGLLNADLLFEKSKGLACLLNSDSGYNYVGKKYNSLEQVLLSLVRIIRNELNEYQGNSELKKNQLREEYETYLQLLIDVGTEFSLSFLYDQIRFIDSEGSGSAFYMLMTGINKIKEREKKINLFARRHPEIITKIEKLSSLTVENDTHTEQSRPDLT